MNHTIFARRKRINTIGLTLSVGAMSLGMVFFALDSGDLVI